jgi:uncharacterized protein
MTSRLVVLLIRIYQVILSPLLGPSCRFEPSCSRYAIACVETHGVVKGLWLAVRRISRCHPFNPGGYDPPPGAPGARNETLYAAAAGCREHSR